MKYFKTAHDLTFHTQSHENVVTTGFVGRYRTGIEAMLSVAVLLFCSAQLAISLHYIAAAYTCFIVETKSSPVEVLIITFLNNIQD